MLSVCIVNWNTKTYLRETLASLYAYPPENEEMEVVVVDNASRDGSAEMVDEEFPDAGLIVSRENLGYADANNIALRRALGDMLLLLNPDVRVFKDTLTNALAFLRSRQRAGAISVRFRNPDGTLQRSLRGFPSPVSLACEILGVRRLMPRSRTFGAYFHSWFDYSSEIETDQPMGTFLMIPRPAYETTGELDTDFPIFFNEVDWCYRAKQHGWKIYYTPTAEIVHYGAQGTKQAPKAFMVRESHDSLIRFYEKHYKGTIPTALYSAIIAAIRMGCWVRLLRAVDK